MGKGIMFKDIIFMAVRRHLDPYIGTSALERIASDVLLDIKKQAERFEQTQFAPQESLLTGHLNDFFTYLEIGENK